MSQPLTPRAGRWAVALLFLVVVAAGAAAPALALPAVIAPTAAIGAFDCSRLEVEFVLDNSRSTAAVTYGYSAAFRSPLHPPYRGADARVDLEVAAGASKVVVLPVRHDARTDVTVHLPDGGHVVSQGSCGSAPHATFGLVRCDTLQWAVALDNSTSGRPTRYRWAVADPAGPVRSESVVVDAGDVLGVEVPVVPDSWTDVVVTVDGGGAVASSDRQTCGRMVLDPRASFGVVNCTDVSAPVLLDNSRTTTRLRFTLPGHAVVVGAGESRSLRLHLPVSDRVAVMVDGVLAAGGQSERAVTSTARCAVPPASSSAYAGAGDGSDAGTEARKEAEAGAVGARMEAAGAAAAHKEATGAVPPASGAVGGPDHTTAASTLPLALGAAALLVGVGLALLASRRRRAPTR